MAFVIRSAVSARERALRDQFMGMLERGERPSSVCHLSPDVDSLSPKVEASKAHRDLLAKVGVFDWGMDSSFGGQHSPRSQCSDAASAVSTPSGAPIRPFCGESWRRLVGWIGTERSFTRSKSGLADTVERKGRRLKEGEGA